MAPRTPARAPARTASSRQPAVEAPSSAVRGANAGLARMREEQAKAAARSEASKLTSKEPFRFFCEVGQTREIVVVDYEPAFFRNEHALQHPKTKRYNLFLPCIDEVANCPVCSVDTKQAYFGMYLTIIDLTPFVNSRDEEVLWTKKMLVVKLSQQKIIARLFEQHGTLRGMILQMSRDAKLDASIGNDIQFIEFMSEEDLATYETEYEDNDGNLHEVYGNEPFDYDEIYPDLSEDQLAQLAGIKGADEGRAVRSSRASARHGDAQDNEPPPGRAARHAGARAEPQAAPARRAPRAAPQESTPAPRRAAPARAQSQEAPAPRAATRPARSAPQDPPQRAARRAPSNPLPDDEAEAPAPAATADRAARRAQLRGSR